jgi:hypothetical protein
VAVCHHALDVKVDIAALGGVCQQGKAQRVGAALLDAVGEVGSLPHLGLLHLWGSRGSRCVYVCVHVCAKNEGKGKGAVLEPDHASLLGSKAHGAGVWADASRRVMQQAGWRVHARLK